MPESKRTPVEVARKTRERVSAGAIVVGPKPESDPGLKDYPKCDAEVKQIAGEVWGDCDGETIRQRNYGKGRVVWGKSLRDILSGDGIVPDFTYSGTNGSIDFIHRRDGDTEIYFLAIKPVMEVTGAWQVTFDPDWLYPTNGLSGDAARHGLVRTVACGNYRRGDIGRKPAGNRSRESLAQSAYRRCRAAAGSATNPNEHPDLQAGQSAASLRIAWSGAVNERGSRVGKRRLGQLKSRVRSRLRDGLRRATSRDP